MTDKQQQLIEEIRRRNLYRQARHAENKERGRIVKRSERKKRNPTPTEDIDTLLRILEGSKRATAN